MIQFRDIDETLSVWDVIRDSLYYRSTMNAPHEAAAVETVSDENETVSTPPGVESAKKKGV